MIDTNFNPVLVNLVKRNLAYKLNWTLYSKLWSRKLGSPDPPPQPLFVTARQSQNQTGLAELIKQIN